MPDTETAHPDHRPRDLGKRHLTYRVIAMPADTNGTGHIFGGWLMSQVDLTGSILAFEGAGGRVATRAVNEFQFLKPVTVGDVISCYARVLRVGNTSIEIGVEVDAEKIGDPMRAHRVAEARLTYVTLTGDGQTRRLVDCQSN